MKHTRSRLVLLVLVLLAGCFGPLRKPMPSLYYHAPPQGGSDTLLVMLPGILDQMDDFARAGFISELQAHAIPTDVISVDSHAGYYFAGQLIERLHNDVILPARRQGYRHIWLIGISLGGMGSLLYAREHPEQVEGIVLIAPFLGRDSQLKQLHAEGLRSWLDSPEPPLEIDRLTREVWQWAATRDASRRPALYLAYARQDRYAADQQLFARLGTPTLVITQDGTHDWGTWQQLWRALLQSPLGPALGNQESLPPHLPATRGSRRHASE